LAQVAAAAGVATSTASLVLSGRGTEVRISDRVQELVRATADDLGYRPNAVSVGLRKGETSTLGFVSDSVASSRLAGEMIKGAIEAARDRGYMLFVGETSGNAHQERLLLDAMFDRQVDGVILASMLTHVRDIPADITRTPAVLLNLEPEQPIDVPAVVPDERQSGRDAATALIEAGHTDIHLIGAGPTLDHVPPFSLAARQRLEGILEVMDGAGLRPASGHVVNQWLPPDGWRLVSALLEAARPQALICFNDRLAMGAYQALQEHGLRVPDDCSIVSFDDATIASWLRPGLTTLALPHRAMGKRASELLIAQIEAARGRGDAPRPGPHLVPMPMRTRGSLAAPAQRHSGPVSR
jgi:LacI family transcriptional regulator